MKVSIWPTTLVALTLAACAPNDLDQLIDREDSDIEDSDQPCSPELSIENVPRVSPGEIATLVGNGGTGNYRFRIVTDSTDGIVNELTGAYLAGEVDNGEVTVSFAITDLGCRGEGEGSILVSPSLQLVPEAITVSPDQSFTYEVRFGSGPFNFEVVEGAGSISTAGLFTAGDSGGTARVVLTDTATGKTATSDVSIAVGSVFTLTPAEVYLPVGADFELQSTGGSGYLEVTGSAPGFEVVDQTLSATSAGEQTLTLRDRFTGQTADLRVSAQTSLRGTAVPAGNADNFAAMAQAYDASGLLDDCDLDGDGTADLVVGIPTLDAEQNDGGAVLVYYGGTTISDSPDVVFAGANDSDELGRSVVVADFDHDGLLDIAAGAPRMDMTGGDSGAVIVYYGDGNRFADPRTQILAGESGFDRFGQSLGAGDVNGDGLVDLVVGAYEDESPEGANNQGSIAVYLGADAELGFSYDSKIFGRAPDSTGAWVDTADLRLGRQIGVGDFDGDGLADVAAGLDDFNSTYLDDPVDPDRDDDGALMLFLGRGAGSSDDGGFDAEPAGFWTNQAAPEADAGQRVAMGDLDGDGRADIAVALPEAAPDGDPNRGQVAVIYGRALTTADALANDLSAAATAVLSGVENYDRFGDALQIGRFDSGRALAVGSPYRDPESGYDVGSLAIFAGGGLSSGASPRRKCWAAATPPGWVRPLACPVT